MTKRSSGDGASSYCYATGLELGRAALQALCEAGLVPSLAIGYDPSLSHRSGYVSLRELATDFQFELLETDNINSPTVFAHVAASAPDLLVVAGWSQLVRDPLLSSFPLEAVGLHPTALPRGRGRAPIPWTLIKGLPQTAVSLFYLTAEADAGDIIDQEPIEVSRRDDASSLYEKVAGAHASILTRSVPKLLAGTNERRPQGTGDSWPKRRPEDGLISWASTAEELYNWVRGLTHPYPGAFTFVRKTRLTVWTADMLPQDESAAAPGEILGPVWSATTGGVAVACQGGMLILRMVQIDGSGEIDALSLYEDGMLKDGERLG